MPALAVLGGIIAFFGIWAFEAIYSGYALTVLWAWFVVPTFHLPQLSVVTAIGLAIVVSYLTHQIDTDDKEEGNKKSWGERFGMSITYAIIKPSFALFFGWIVHLFM